MLKRILVLDDNQDILDIVNEALVYEHFEVKITSCSEQIMNMLLTYKPNLVILDHKINGPNGFDICRQIKTHPQFYNIPVIICSAYLTDGPLIACGCDAIIAKPFGLAELINKVNGLVLQ